MSKLLRKYLIPVLVIAMTGTGVSFAATGGLSSFHRHAPEVTNQDDSTDVEPTPSADDQNEQADQNDNENDQQDPIETPDSTPVARSHDGCPEGFDGNHGQFVSQSEDHHAAARSDCGKPEQSVNPSEHETEPTETPEVEHSDDNHDGDGSGDNVGEHSGDEHEPTPTPHVEEHSEPTPTPDFEEHSEPTPTPTGDHI